MATRALPPRSVLSHLNASAQWNDQTMSALNAFERHFPACKVTASKVKAKRRHLSNDEITKSLIFSPEILIHYGHLLVYPTFVALSKRLHEIGEQCATQEISANNLPDFKLAKNIPKEIFHGYAASLRNTQIEINTLNEQVRRLTRQLDKLSKTDN